MSTWATHNNLKRLRFDRGLSQWDVALKLRMSQSTYAQTELGRRLPKGRAELKRIARAIGCKEADLGVTWEQVRSDIAARRKVVA